MKFRPPNEEEARQAIGSPDGLPKRFRKLFLPSGDFEPVPAPGPNDWLAVHPEPGQTLAGSLPKYNATTRKAINNNGLAFVSDESFSEFFAGIYAIYKHVAPQSRRPSGMLARAFSRQN